MHSFSYFHQRTLALYLILLSATGTPDNMAFAFQSPLFVRSPMRLLQVSRTSFPSLSTRSMTVTGTADKDIEGGPAAATTASSSLKVVPNHDAYEKVTMDEIVSLCKRRGFIFPSSEIYNGFAGFYDYGPLGAELKKNVKDVWWKTFVTVREDVVGLDSSIIHNPTTWKSSGTLLFCMIGRMFLYFVWCFL